MSVEGDASPNVRPVPGVPVPGVPVPGVPPLVAVLEEARRLGFLGPGPVLAHVRLAEGMIAAYPGCGPDRILDLGSGGGVPGLVLAMSWPRSECVLLDSQLRRTTFLTSAVARLGLMERVRIVRARAEDAGRDPELRGGFDLVVARSFASPPVTAECGAPFLRVGGRLVVSEPPSEGAGRRERWPDDALMQVGLRVERRRPSPAAWIALIQQRPCPERFPRRSGVPAKRPLYRISPGAA